MISLNVLVLALEHGKENHGNFDPEYFVITLQTLSSDYGVNIVNSTIIFLPWFHRPNLPIGTPWFGQLAYHSFTIFFLRWADYGPRTNYTTSDSTTSDSFYDL